MDIRDFTYRTTPVKKTRMYEVHTLSPDGLHQYLDKNSYVHRFLKNPNSETVNKDEECQNNLYISDANLANKFSNKDLNRNLGESKDFNNKNQNEKGTVITINMNNFHKNIYYKPSNYNYSDGVEKNESSKNNNLFSNFNNNHQNSELSKNEEFPLYEKKQRSVEEKSNFDNISNNLESKVKKNTFLQTSKQLLINPKKYIQNRYNQNRYNNQKYSEDYQTTINSLKEKFSNNFISNTSKNSSSPQRITYGTFKSYEVPHLNTQRQSSNFRVNLIRNKLENTLLKTGKDSKHNSSVNDIDNLNKRIEDENKKLKNYFDNINRFTQDQGFYPSVSQITNSNNLRTTKVKLYNNKYMGERYDPSNFA